LSEREHETPFIRKSGERFKVRFFLDENNLSNLRWAVDKPADYVFVTKVFENLYLLSPDFLSSDKYDLLSNEPELIGLNSIFQLNEGLVMSEDEARKWLKKSEWLTVNNGDFIQ